MIIAKHATPITLVATVAILLAGCSSTTDDTDSTDADSTSNAVTTDASSPSGSPAPSVATEPTASIEPTTSATDPPTDVVGVEDDVVKLGFVVSTNQAAASEQAGAEGITTIAQDAAVRILVDDLNDRGGLDGRTVEPVLFEVDATANLDEQTIASAYCATFTDDNEVYAVLAAGEPSAEQRACLAEAGVPAISAGGAITFLDDSAYEDAPLLANVSGLSLDAVARSLVAGLDVSGWFDGANVGVLRLQDDAFDGATERSLLPALEAAGVEVVEEVAIASIASQDDIGRVSTEAQNAVLRMKDAEVDHLIFFESGGALPFFFQSAASAQSYAPALGFSTTSGGQTLVENLGTGGTGIGWSPLVDVPLDDRPASEQAQRCFDLLDPTGAAFTTAVARSQAVSFCDIVWLTEAAVAAGGLTDGAGTIASIESLGDGYRPASLDRATFGPDKRYGVAEYRLVQYDEVCGCNVYGPEPAVAVE
jgi:ABC-type branched-subunit amino acid transport system substrate-binding protein